MYQKCKSGTHFFQKALVEDFPILTKVLATQSKIMARTLAMEPITITVNKTLGKLWTRLISRHFYFKVNYLVCSIGGGGFVDPNRNKGGYQTNR